MATPLYPQSADVVSACQPRGAEARCRPAPTSTTKTSIFTSFDSQPFEFFHGAAHLHGLRAGRIDALAE
jgi:hypothetical protein